MATGLRLILASSLRTRAPKIWRQPKAVTAPAVLSLEQKRYGGGMPQLDVTTFMSQYSWTMLSLFTIYAILVNTIMPKMQQQAAILEQARQFQPDEETSAVARPEVQVLRSLFSKGEDK